MDHLIHSYSRAQAIADRVLVDVSRQASPAEMHGGFTVPVAVTATLWSAIEAIPERLLGIADPRGRLHDVLWMAGCAVRRQQRDPSFALFALRSRDGCERAKLDPKGENLARSTAEGAAAASRPILAKAPRCQVPPLSENLARSELLPFAVHLPYRGTRTRMQRLAVVVGPDDDGTPCVSIGFPGDL